jgi:hypothetical protein
MRERVVDSRRSEDLFFVPRLLPPRVGVQSAVAVVLRRDLRQRLLSDPELVHVAVDLHREELSRVHHPGLDVPGTEPDEVRVGRECASRVFVETDGHRGVDGAR